MKFTLATKASMTQLFDEAGLAHPATVLSVGPVVVTQVKTVEKDGYSAVQVGIGAKQAKNVSKPVRGHLKAVGKEDAPFLHIKEFRVSEDELKAFEVGKEVDLTVFTEGDTVAVSADSKSKGFQGVVKRHNFAGGPRTHGQKHNERSPGSIGGGLRTRVPKNMKMAGRMGGRRITVKNLKVLVVDAANHRLIVGGAVPGRRGTLVEVTSK